MRVALCRLNVLDLNYDGKAKIGGVKVYKLRFADCAHNGNTTATALQLERDQN